jgi:hypothetical protein
MSHFAQVKNNIVQRVIVAEQDFINNLSDKQDWIQTSYNTHGGVHYAPNVYPLSADGGAALRANYAGIGYIYDPTYDVFYAPKPAEFNSWVLNLTSFLWEPPIPYPADGNSYIWDEKTVSWIPYPAS